MDANRHIIPIVEDDQGEGFMDPLEAYAKAIRETDQEILKNIVMMQGQ